MTVECFYCGEPGCTCGVRVLDRCKRALEMIVEWQIDEEDSPRETFRNVRELAMDALQGTGQFSSAMVIESEKG